MLANEKDYIATRVAHKLNLTGPAVSVHTGVLDLAGGDLPGASTACAPGSATWPWPAAPR